MKTRYFIFTLIIGCSLFTSCFNLDEKVYDTITVDNLGKTPEEIDAIIGPVYSTLNKFFPDNFLDLIECSGDMAITPTRRGGDWFDGGTYRDLHMHTWSANTNTLKNCWNAATQAISTCNLVHETVKNSPLEDNAKTRALAEIRGVRAFWIYQMLDNWGNIPLVTDFTQTTLPGITPRKDVYDFLVKEVNEIKDLLVEEVSGASYGKFTKGAAYTLLAKLYLNAQAWGVDAPRWREAADACDVVMNLGYIIEPDWKTNFQVNNENSRETIFAICFSTNDPSGSRNIILYRTLHYFDGIALGAKFSPWNGISAQSDYVKLFHYEDKRLSGSFLTGEMRNPATGEIILTAHGRPLIHTVDINIIPGSEYAGSTWGQVQQEDGARAYKWVYDINTINAMENDFQLFRLADVYLMKAEALVRLGDNNAEATRLVNVIRERGFGNTTHNYESVTLEQIALERKFELAWECFSRQDNIRFGTFQDARFLKPDTKGKDHLNLFPIPIDAWQTNSNLVQNPGYPAF